MTVVKRDNSKGAALLGVLTTLSGPARKRICLSKGPLSTVHRGSLSGFEESRLKFMFRSFGLLSAFGLGSGVLLPLMLRKISCEGVGIEVVPVIGRLKVTKLLRGCPCRISKKRGRHTTITETLVASPELVLTSRPAKTLSSGSASRLLKMFRQVGRSKRAVLVMARSIGTTDGTKEILFVGSKRIFRRMCGNRRASRRFCRGVSTALAVLTANNRER